MEMIVALLRVLFSIFLKGLRKDTEILRIGVPVEIRTRCLSD
jgi:hypothetical protein